MFLIRDVKSGAVLFLGRVMVPGASGGDHLRPGSQTNSIFVSGQPRSTIRTLARPPSAVCT
ncbi:MAG: hypothetical protein H6838_10490 [Planctomycetes bacterium]|nr:hypothetical protein [Planctomycetota bacterium]MCB9885913.1 hypothetical protein [Planctomycetota bacterium]